MDREEKLIHPVFTGLIGCSSNTRDHGASLNFKEDPVTGRWYSTWSNSDSYENYLKVKDKNNTIYDENSFGYDVNAQLFRCDNFNLISEDTYNVVFLGCSVTYGVGLPLHHSWSKILHGEISARVNKRCPYINLACGGRGAEHQARMLYLFAKQFKKIDAVIILFPSLSRCELMLDEWSIYNIIPKAPAKPLRHAPEHGSYLKVFEELHELNMFPSAYRFNNALMTIDMVSRLTGAKVIADTWDSGGRLIDWVETEFYEKFFFDSPGFIHGHRFARENNIPVSWARDFMHPPKVCHEAYVESIQSHVFKTLGLS